MAGSGFEAWGSIFFVKKIILFDGCCELFSKIYNVFYKKKL